MDSDQLKELLCQSLETERGGVKVYDAALRCVIDDELKEEWTKYHDQTQEHVEILEDVFEKLELDPQESTPGSEIVKAKGEALVEAMGRARSAGRPEAAQLVAAECVIDAETKDHLNWELLAEAAKALEGEQARALKQAVDKVEQEEDEHLYHTMGWCRELWLADLGLPAVLPPPEETKHVKTMLAAARARQGRGAAARKAGGGRRAGGRKGGRVKSRA